jgi:chemotaxis response regulator CheB
MGDHTIGIILSGAGDDGVEGIHEIIRSGGEAMVQAPTRCFCRALPLAVINRCGINRILTDQEMVREINSSFDSARNLNRNGSVAGIAKNHSNAPGTARNSDAERTGTCN